MTYTRDILTLPPEEAKIFDSFYPDKYKLDRIPLHVHRECSIRILELKLPSLKGEDLSRAEWTLNQLRTRA